MTQPPGLRSILGIARALRRRGRDEDGVVLVLVAFLMVVILASAALAIDLGSFFQAQRQAQAAADAGALAAAQDLPSATSAGATGTTYATTNYPGATATVSTPYNGSTGAVKVTVNATTPSFFGQFLGLTSENVSASAVAGATGASAKADIFAYDSTCSGAGVLLTANSMKIDGAIISNGSLLQNGNPSSTYGPTSYGGPNGCSYTNNGTGTFSSGPTANPQLIPYPQDWRTMPPTCTYSAANFTWSGTGATIPSGVYCATGTITLSGANMNASNVTFIANQIIVSGNNCNVSAPSATNLLFWQTGTSTMDITSQNITIGGTIFVPSAGVIFEGNASGTGFIEANDVTLTGNSFSVSASGPVMYMGGVSLLQ